MNPAKGDGGTCYGDSGGPNFLGAGTGETDIVAGTTITGDFLCRATNVDYRMDTPSARAFLGRYVRCRNDLTSATAVFAAAVARRSRWYSSPAANVAEEVRQLSGVVVAETAICSIDPERGVLMYRGYDIADLAEHATYEEVAYLLLEGDLPDGDRLGTFEEELAARELPRACTTISTEREGRDADGDAAHRRLGALLFRSGRGRDRPRERAPQGRALIAQLPTIVARHERRRRGERRSTRTRR